MGREGRTVTISLPPELARKADRTAREEGRTRSELFREALRQYLERRERWRRILRASEELARRNAIREDNVVAAVLERRHRR